MRTKVRAIGVLLASIVVVASTPRLYAQTVVEGTQALQFDRPDVWARTYFTSVTILGGCGAPREIDAGTLEVGLPRHLSLSVAHSRR